MGESRRRLLVQRELQRITDKLGNGGTLTPDEKAAIGYDDMPPQVLAELRAVYARGETMIVKLASAHATDEEAHAHAVSEAARLGVPGPNTKWQ
jgi:hypothetical protein